MVRLGPQACLSAWRSGLPSYLTGVNLAWEAFQLPLYTIWWSDPWSSIIFALVHCTVGDLMICSAALALALGIAGRGWPAEGQARRRVVTVTTLVGVSYTISASG